ncbi:MAG: rhodanese-like domain-containing protein [Minisyncoccia bacterium]
MNTIILFYRFVDIAKPEAVRDEQRALCEQLGLKGRILIATEGINGTLEGTPEKIAAYQERMQESELFRGMPFKESEGTGDAFRKLEVKVRSEVVTLGAGTFDIAKETAPEITADELQRMYEDNDDFVVLDLRNNYEIQAGYFEKTEHPNMRNFRELPEKIGRIAHLKKKKVVAVCTGGIRCEKATCLLKKEGFEDIVQLKDGIHTYMQKYPGERFKGSLFVFDNRMTTPVKDSPTREIVGRCVFCATPSEDIYSNDSVRPSEKVIACQICVKVRGKLRVA